MQRLLLTCAVLGCAPARALAPLAPGEVAIDAAAPALFLSDPPTAIPNVKLSTRAGVAENVEARLTLEPVHLLLAHRKILALGAGGIWHVSAAEGWTPALHFSADLMFYAPVSGPHRPGDPRLAVVADAAVIAHWEPVDWLFPYAVFDAAARSHDGPPYTSLFVGAQLWPKGIIALTLELGWFGFSIHADEYTANVVSAGWGALYLGTGLTVRLEG